jgi:hypothetical protein
LYYFCLCKLLKELFSSTPRHFLAESGCKGTNNFWFPQAFGDFFLPKGGTFSRLLTNVKTEGAKHYINYYADEMVGALRHHLRGGAGHCYTDEMVGARRHHLAAVTWRGGGRWLRSKKSQRLLKIWSAPNFKKALTFWGQ